MGLAVCLCLAGCGDLGPPREVQRAFQPDTTTEQIRWLTRAQAEVSPPPPPAPRPVDRRRPSPAAGGGLTDAQLARLVACESGGRYGIQNYPYSGAAQWTESTWDSQRTGYDHAWQAPPEVQDAATRRLWADGRGAGNWPVCRHRV